MRHYFVLDDAEYVIVGYNGDIDKVAIVCLNALSLIEQQELCEIIDTEQAQQELDLIVLLAHKPCLQGGWHTWAERVMGWVTFTPLTEMERLNVCVDQIQTFKRSNPKYVEMENSHTDIGSVGNIEEILYGQVGRDLEV